MTFANLQTTIFVIFLIGIQESRLTNGEQVTQQQLDEKSNPLANLILHENEIGDVSRNGNHTKETSRVKRQFYYDPYYSRRRVPVPIIIGGLGFGGFYGLGGGGFVGRGFGGRGFGGRGFGGRGFGGRGFGGGRGIGGFGGRGIGGGFGGRGGGRG